MCEEWSSPVHCCMGMTASCMSHITGHGLPLSQFSRMMPASCLPLPIPAPVECTGYQGILEISIQRRIAGTILSAPWLRVSYLRDYRISTCPFIFKVMCGTCRKEVVIMAPVCVTRLTWVQKHQCGQSRTIADEKSQPLSIHDLLVPADRFTCETKASCDCTCSLERLFSIISGSFSGSSWKGLRIQGDTAHFFFLAARTTHLDEASRTDSSWMLDSSPSSMIFLGSLSSTAGGGGLTAESDALSTTGSGCGRPICACRSDVVLDEIVANLCPRLAAIETHLDGRLVLVILHVPRGVCMFHDETRVSMISEALSGYQETLIMVQHPPKKSSSSFVARSAEAAAACLRKSGCGCPPW